MKTFIQLVILLAAGIALFIGVQFSIRAFEVFDISMEPTYKAGDFIVVNKLTYLWSPPSRGDVIAFYDPENAVPSSVNPFDSQQSAQFIKRIIAVPGDTVAIKDHKVFVNGCLVDEPYIAESCDYDCKTQTIPAGEYFVLGDNRNHSDDSHRGWLAKREDIIGNVCMCYWHAGYPDIHIVLIPAFIFIVLIFSQDAIDTIIKRKPGKRN